MSYKKFNQTRKTNENPRTKNIKKKSQKSCEHLGRYQQQQKSYKKKKKKILTRKTKKNNEKPK